MSLPSLYPEGHIFIEKTKDEQQHGGPGWEFGTCLWSPTTNRGGGRIYELMLEPKPGDLIIHDYYFAPSGRPRDFYFSGTSRVKESAKKRRELPPNLGVWSFATEVYRIELEGYTPFEKPLAVEDFLQKYAEEIADEMMQSRKDYYPFCFYGDGIRHVQGGYLTIPSSRLFDLLVEEFGSEEGLAIGENNGSSVEDKRGTREGAAMIREITYFARNRAMADRLKRERGFTCEVCGFSPRKEFGEDYMQTALDCHHHNPIAVVRQETLTRDSDVSVICANCHRLVHTGRPVPLTIAETKEIRKRPRIS